MLRARSIGDVARDVARYAKLYGRRPPLGLGLLRALRGAKVGKAVFPPWLNPDLVRRCALRDRFFEVWSRWRESGWGSAAAIPNRFRLPYYQSIWESLDPGFSGVKLNVRLPLLDLRIVSYVLAIPPLEWYAQKRLLRLTMREKLPSEVLQRPKTPVHGYWEARLRQPGLADRIRSMRPAPELSEYVSKEVMASFDPAVPAEQGSANLRPWILNGWLSYALAPGALSLGTKEVAC
jgi:asparagine synthase (glutamine-hydrolysing)